MSESVLAHPRIGTELAGYRIERVLGRGGMSVVYLFTLRSYAHAVKRHDRLTGAHRQAFD